MWTHLLLLLACGPKAPAPSPMDLATEGVAAPEAEGVAEAELSEVMDEGEATHPPPYTLAQFREGWVPGVEVRFRIEKRGHPTTLHHWEVLSQPEPDHVEIRFSVFREDDGTPLGEPRVVVSVIEELLHHASFSTADTTMEARTVETPFGAFAGRRYVRTDPDTPGIVSTFDFADALVGPPTRMVVTVEGEVVDEMVMISRSPLPPASPAP